MQVLPVENMTILTHLSNQRPSQEHFIVVPGNCAGYEKISRQVLAFIFRPLIQVCAP